MIRNRNIIYTLYSSVYNMKTRKNKNNNKNNNKNKNKNKNKTHKKRRADLKNNFYYFVNSEWVKKTYISKDTTQKNLFTILHKKVDKDLLKTIQKHLLNANTLQGKQCNALYKSLTIWNDEIVENQAYLFIKKINEFRKGSNGSNSNNMIDCNVRSSI